jgi:hypothetical protein
MCGGSSSTYAPLDAKAVELIVAAPVKLTTAAREVLAKMARRAKLTMTRSKRTGIFSIGSVGQSNPTKVTVIIRAARAITTPKCRS